MENRKIKFNKDDFDITKIKNSILEFFLEHSEILFMIFFVGMVSFSGFLIYRYIYFSSWNDDKKNAYLQEIKKGEIDFKADDFDSVIEKVRVRNEAYAKNNTDNVRDIFGIEK
jgi:hypothetical protein